MTDLETLLTKAKQSPKADYYEAKVREKAGLSSDDDLSYFSAKYLADELFDQYDINALLWLQKEIDLESK